MKTNGKCLRSPAPMMYPFSKSQIRLHGSSLHVVMARLSLTLSTKKLMTQLDAKCKEQAAERDKITKLQLAATAAEEAMGADSDLAQRAREGHHAGQDTRARGSLGRWAGPGGRGPAGGSRLPQEQQALAGAHVLCVGHHC